MASDNDNVVAARPIGSRLSDVRDRGCYVCCCTETSSADLLRKIEQPSALGDWSYIPIECKLASKPKTTFLVQALAYCELLTPLLGDRPDQFELYLGGGKFRRYATDRFWAWYQLLRQRFAAFQQSFDPSQPPEDAPGDHGGWTAFIDERLEQQRDLMLVAGMRQSQRQKLRADGINTIEQLAALPAGSSVKGLSGEALHELRQQAELQLTPVDANGRPAYRLRPLVAGKGLSALPAADPGDIWFDMEGIQDSVAGTKLEYLFGACYRDSPEGKPRFRGWWAHSEAEEKTAFAAWVDWVEARRWRWRQAQGRAWVPHADSLAPPPRSCTAPSRRSIGCRSASRCTWCCTPTCWQS